MSYEGWRNQFPWTDAQIVAALREEAAQTTNTFIAWKLQEVSNFIERTGRVTAKAMYSVIPRLVTTCVVCGRKALYRVKTTGFCRAHRDLAVSWRAEVGKAIDADIGEKTAAIDEALHNRDMGERLRAGRDPRRRKRR